MVETLGGTWNIRGFRNSFRNVTEVMQANKIDWLVVTETHLQPETLPLDRNRWLQHSATRPLATTADGFRRAGRHHGGICFIANPAIVKNMAVIATDPQANFVVYELNGLRIIGVYLPPSLDIAAFSDYLDKIGDHLPTDPNQPAIITGDFNLSMEWEGNNLRDCARGRILKDYLDLHALTPATPDDGNFGTTLAQEPRWYDLCLLNAKASALMTGHQHYQNYRGYSDHIPVATRLDLPVAERQHIEEPVPTNLRFKITKLEDPQIASKHLEMLEQQMADVDSWLDEQMELFQSDAAPTKARRQTLANQIMSKLDHAIMHTAKITLGIQRPDVDPNGRTERKVQSGKISRLEAVCKILQRQIIDQKLPATDWRHERIQETQIKLRQAMRKQNREDWEGFADQISTEKVSLFLSTLKRIKRGKQRGAAPDLAQEELNSIAETYEKQMCPCETDTEFGTQPRQLPPAEVGPREDQGNPWDSPLPGDNDRRFSPEHVKLILKASGAGKASGPDNICKELLGKAILARPGQEECSRTVTTIAKVFKAIYEIGMPPASWSQALVVPIYKNKGSRQDWSNWRPISLLPFLRKIFECCFKEAIVKDGYHAMQGGFSPKKSTLDQVATLDHAIHILKRRKKHRYMAFLDIWAAFDSVDRNILWKLCKDRGMADRDIQFLSILQEANESRVIGRNKQSRAFTARAGVQQGGTISPLLYNVLIDLLCERLDRLGIGVYTIVRRHIPGGMFADDVAIICDSPEKLQMALNVCESYSQEFAFRWKPSKSFVVASDESVAFSIYGGRLGFVVSFNYLGIPIGVDGIVVDELLTNNIKKAKEASRYMSMLGVNALGFTPYRNALAWKSFVRPCYEYGLSLVQLTPTQLQRLDQSLNATLKKAIGGYSRSSSAAIQELCLVDPAEVRVSYLQLRQIMRMMHAAPTTLVKRWLGDALQDSTSPLRLLMDSNGLFDQVWKKTPMGPELRQLWTETERAASFFGRQEGLPWPARADGQFTDIPVIQDDEVNEWKLEQKRKRMMHAVQEGSGKLWRDLPPVSKDNNPLKALKLPRMEWRLLLGWLTDFFPSYRPDQVCHVRGEQDIASTLYAPT